MNQLPNPTKPYILKRWRLNTKAGALWFFTCARPGRTGDPASKNMGVPDEIVNRWVLGLPGPETAIVSLLGRKPDGMSEFSFYSFYGGFDSPSDRPGCLSFQEWMDTWHGSPSIVIREQPSYDFRPMEPEALNAVSGDITELAGVGRTVVLIDSGGVTRTGRVCRHLGAVEAPGGAAPVRWP